MLLLIHVVLRATFVNVLQKLLASNWLGLGLRPILSNDSHMKCYILYGATEVAQRLRALTTLVEVLHSIPNNHMATQNLLK